MNRSGVVDWLKAYAHAWETYDPSSIGNLFNEHATYSYYPFEQPVAGRDAIVASWLANRDAHGTYEGHYEPIAIEGDVAVTNGRSRYFKDSTRSKLTKEWDNIFVIKFDEHGRCLSFREWFVARRRQK